MVRTSSVGRYTDSLRGPVGEPVLQQLQAPVTAPTNPDQAKLNSTNPDSAKLNSTNPEPAKFNSTNPEPAKLVLANPEPAKLVIKQTNNQSVNQ